MDIRASDFTRFFRAVHGHPPFPWQQRLVDRLADDEWPDVLDVPTGAGKTAALDAAVFHLALRADEPSKAALRIALVVDRRLIVDDAFARATKIAKALCRANRDGGEECETVHEVARRLGRLAGANAPPLVAKRLRGGAPLEHDWARTPTQPTVLCSTVDQVGSRLLFRGYGVSDRMKPVHAGLLGTDSLILLDEAHLSDPFRLTVDAVRELGRATVKSVVLSATPGVCGKRPLSLREDDRVDPVLKARLEARKPAALSVVPKKANVAAAFATAARRVADRLRLDGVSGFAVGIVVNRVRLAREIYNHLTDGGDEEIDTLLMIGRSRSVCRDSLDAKLKPFRTGESGRAAARPLFVVSTQCLEVGVDLDLDALVTQAAALDALRQRFGRLNRGGREVSAQGDVLALAGDIGKGSVDPVYGDRIPLTWEALTRLADDGNGGKVDFGILAMDGSGIDVSSLAAPMAKAPVLMPAYLDLWSHTSPRPTADPEVELFLHGSRTVSTDVSIVWRSDIDDSIMQDRNEKQLRDLVALVPPRAAEMVAVPLWAARSWLRASDAGQAGDISDAPATPAEDRRAFDVPIQGRCAYRWAGPEDPRTGLVRPGDIRPGDILIVPASFGGCDEFGWSPDDSAPVKDVADEAAFPFRERRAFARIARDAAGEDDALWLRIRAVVQDESLDDKDRIDFLLETFDRETNDLPIRDVRESLRGLLRARGQIRLRRPYVGESEGGVVLVAEGGLHADGEEYRDSAAPATEDESIANMSTKPVSLDRHGCDVEKFVRGFAETLQLPCQIVEDVCLAAFLHDAGKADSRFQALLSGGDSWSCPGDRPLAKSQRSWNLGAWERAGLPPGWRHEALSVRMARVHPRFREARDPALVLWLIGTHHGFGRPFYRFNESEGNAGGRDLLSCLDVVEWPIDSVGPGPQSMGFQFESMDWPELFAQLKRRHGVWGLAHLEAILRLADHRASELGNRS